MTTEMRNSVRADDSPACLLCGEKKSEIVEQLTGAQLRALWKQENCEFPAEAWGTIGEQYVVAMHRCLSCGFLFFDPALAGNEVFYRSLNNGEYYSGARPEFHRTIQFAQRHGLKRILDIGCGSGAFLDMAREAGLQAVGLELSSSAAKVARSKGHTVFEELLHELNPTKTSGGFDMICFFQVMEHLPNPRQAMQQAAALLNPKGCISVAVPSAHGVYRLVPWDPTQWPPHHISRWRISDLNRLGDSAQMKLVESGGDTLLGHEIEHFWKLHNRLAPALGAQPWVGGAWLPGLTSFCYRKTGMKFIAPAWGPSIFGFFQSCR